ncbi:unnamed protein product [Phytophthora lilii]|uniref:Unnamed protein product n=1 Tax=Phytophthora lilii TaxID=2077276 RepID=A0A9W6U8F0_9STRA|nr:unnamed protein product [Phytophthora lilii]
MDLPVSAEVPFGDKLPGYGLKDSLATDWLIFTGPDVSESTHRFSSPDGSSKPSSAAVAVEAHVAQARSGSPGVSSFASASSSSAPSNSVVTREVLEELLIKAGASLRSERVIAVLGPRLEQLGRLADGLQVSPSIRGDRRVRSRVDAAKSLEEVVNAAVSCLDVGGDVKLDLVTMRGQLYSAEAAQAAAEKSLHQEIYRRENAEVLAKTAFGERDSLRVEPRRSKEAQAQLVKKVEQLVKKVEQLNAIVAKCGAQLPRLKRSLFTRILGTWQVVRRQLPSHACLFSTVDFDVNVKVSQRASFDQRLCTYWRSFRGFGDEEDADLGYALWERDHWIPARAVELFFSHAFAVLANIDSARFGPEDQARICRELEAARAKWVVYLADRTKRCDRLRVKLVYKVWRWAVDEDPALADIPPEFLFKSSIPGYSFEYLTWVPKSSAWLSEVAALDELQPWRTGWVGAPAQHPYNTTFVPCNPSAPMFVPVGFSRESVGRQIQVDPAQTASEVSAGWDSDFRGPASPDLAQMLRP